VKKVYFNLLQYTPIILLDTIGIVNCIIDMLRVLCEVWFKLLLSFGFIIYELSAVKYAVPYFGPYLAVK